MNLQATQDNLILRPIKAGNKTGGGILLPNQDALEDGAVVISIGPQVEDIAVGDIVVRPAPPRYIVDDNNTGEMFFICAEADILAKVLPEVSDKIKEAVDIVGVESRKLRLEVNDAPGQAEEAEKEKEVANSEAREVQPDGISESRVDSLLPLHPVEGLHKDDGD